MLTGAMWDRGDRDHARRQASRELDVDMLVERGETKSIVAYDDRQTAWIASDTWVSARDAR